MSEVLKRLSNVTIIDRLELVKLKGEEMAQVMVEANNDNTKPVRVIDNPSMFFSDDALFEAMELNSPDLKLIAEYRGVKFEDEDLFVIAKMVALKDRIAADLLALVPPPPPYEFATAPRDWKLETSGIVISKTRIYRKGNSEYCIGHKTLERVWKTVSKQWAAGEKGSRYLMSVSAGGYHGRDVRLDDGDLKIGCQRIKRYELEALALKMGWDFPEVTKK